MHVLNLLRNLSSVCTVVLSALALTACSVKPLQADPAKPHHTTSGFTNNYMGAINKRFAELVRWQIDRHEAGLPKPPDRPVATTTPDLTRIANYQQQFRQPGTPARLSTPTITWIGHATMLLQAGGLNILTDPIFSERASPVQWVGPKRAQAPGLSVAQLPPIDVVLISHNHYDHLDRQSVQDVAQHSAAAGTRTLFIVPLGLKPWFLAQGLNHVHEMDWWDTFTARGVRFDFTPTQHWSARSLTDRSQTLWGGWAVFAPDFHWYFAGDTGYSKDFADTATRFAGVHSPEQGGGFDLALLPLGTYQPRWFLAEQHVDPGEAVKIHRDLNAKRSVAIHWGTFALSDESLDQPPRDLAIARAAQGLAPDDFSVMAIGETRVLTPRPQP